MGQQQGQQGKVPDSGHQLQSMPSLAA
jgi:hypothetical protein